MAKQTRSSVPELIQKHEAEILGEWMEEQKSNLRQQTLMKQEELRRQCAEFLGLLRLALQNGKLGDVAGADWTSVRDFLNDMSRSRSLHGFTPSETAIFVFSLKKPLFSLLRRESGKEGENLAEETWNINLLLDKLGLLTTEAYQKSREEIIQRQQQEMLELSTPVVQLWKGVLAVPLIGTLDSARTQIVMESLLQKIVETEAEVAIVDITGVPTVDTLVAQHLIKTVTAARLMGAECIISGIRPQIAQTIVHLGVDLSEVITKASLADALRLALKRSGFAITPVSAAP